MSLQISENKKLEIVRSLSTMITAGIPLYEGVNSLVNQLSGREKIFMSVLKENLNQGKTIAETFSEFPDIFDSVAINSIKIAEETGNLDVAFKTLTQNLEKRLEFIRNLKASLLYPFFVSIVFLFVLIFILVFVVPRIAVVFYSLHVNIPLSAKIMIGTSDFLISYWYIVIIILGLFITGGTVLYKARKKSLFKFLYSLPFISTLGTQIDLANLSRNLNLLLATGVSLNRGLKLCESVVSKVEIENLVKQAESAISEGKDLSYAFINNTKYIPDFMVLMIQTGERTGTLEKSMKILTDYFEVQVYNNVKKISTLLEPVIIILISGMVLVMLLSIITPIYELIGTIGS